MNSSDNTSGHSVLRMWLIPTCKPSEIWSYMLNGFGSRCSSCIVSSNDARGVSMAASILSVPTIHLYSFFSM